MATYVFNLARGMSKNTDKFVCGISGAITGTGTIATGLSTILAAGVTATNSASTTPTNLASIFLLSGGTISVVVIAAASGGNTVSGVSSTIAFWAVGS